MEKKTPKPLKETVIISSELQALEELSKMCGEVKSKEKEKTSSTPLVTVSDLQRMPKEQVIWLRLRMMPFKTKMTPDWQMNKMHAWGETYEKAGYQVREKKEVQLFDIREFVKAKKKEKMESMMNGSGNNPMGGMSSPFGGMANPFSSNPFGGMGGLGGNPFSSLNQPKSSTPFGEETLNSLLGNNDSPKEEASFNVDDLVKKIDAKIAELEEEERKEQEEQKAKEQKVIDAEIENKEDKTLYDEGTHSDDFFNDFFSDD